jgi:hypothetical protein
MEPHVRAGTWSAAQLRSFEAQGIEVERDGAEVRLGIPLAVAFDNPELLQAVGLGPLLRGFAQEGQYRNDEQIDDSLRSILFQVPKPGTRDPAACGTPAVKPGCYSVVQDLGAIDIQRARDHGIPSYNALRAAYGLAPARSYEAITGDAAARFPSDRSISRSKPIDDPDILDFTRLADAGGKAIRRGTDAALEEVVVARRRASLSARLQAIYGPGNVDRVDAFVGMVSEPHVPGSELGELQLAMWRRQFQALRDGDRFFYLNDRLLPVIQRRFGIDYRRSLAQIIRANTGVAVQRDVFTVPAEESTAPAMASRAGRAAPHSPADNASRGGRAPARGRTLGAAARRGSATRNGRHAAGSRRASAQAARFTGPRRKRDDRRPKFVEPRALSLRARPASRRGSAGDGDHLETSSSMPTARAAPRRKRAARSADHQAAPSTGDPGPHRIATMPGWPPPTSRSAPAVPPTTTPSSRSSTTPSRGWSRAGRRASGAAARSPSAGRPRSASARWRPTAASTWPRSTASRSAR